MNVVNVVHSVPWVFREREQKRERDYSFCFQPLHLPIDTQKGAWLWWITLSLLTIHCGGQIPIHISTFLSSGAPQTILKYPYNHLKCLLCLERGFTLKWEVLKRFRDDVADQIITESPAPKLAPWVEPNVAVFNIKNGTLLEIWTYDEAFVVRFVNE